MRLILIAFLCIFSFSSLGETQGWDNDQEEGYKNDETGERAVYNKQSKKYAAEKMLALGSNPFLMHWFRNDESKKIFDRLKSWHNHEKKQKINKIRHQWYSSLSEPQLGFVIDFEKPVTVSTADEEREIEALHADPERCYKMGLEFLEDVDCVPDHLGTAKLWLKRAADKGHALAQAKLQALSGQ